EDRRQRREVGQRERVDEPDAVGRRQLDERQALGIVMEAVALGVERHLGRRGKRTGRRRQRGGVSGPDGSAQRRRSRIERSMRSTRRRSGSRRSCSVWTYTSFAWTAAGPMSRTARGGAG